MVVLLTALSALAAEDYGREGPFRAELVRAEWRDVKRDREVPVTIYSPAAATNPCPVIVFSHGLGGTRDTYEYLGRHWASHGYVCFHVQHHGSDDAVWRNTSQRAEGMRRAAADPRNAMERVLDVSFVLDELERTNSAPEAIHRICDLKRVGLAGHSFGAWTTLAIAGQRIALLNRSFADNRVKAAIPMSAPIPTRRTPQTYSDIRIPLFHLTGTADESPINNTTAKDRRVPFDSITHAPQYLLTFEGGDHMIFSGRLGTSRPASESSAMLAIIKSSTTAFWDSTLKESAEAGEWMRGGGLTNALGRLGTIETKPAK